MEHSLTVEKLLRDIASARLAVDPWRAFIGLIEWRESGYAPEAIDKFYVLTPPPEFGSASVLMHPTVAAKCREQLPAFLRTDAERAAFLWWHARGREASACAAGERTEE